MAFSLLPETQHSPLFMHILLNLEAVHLAVQRGSGLLHTNQPEELIKNSSFWWHLLQIQIEWTGQAPRLGSHHDK